jgi:hypothetical protein
MTTASNSDAIETPGLPGFRVFGATNPTDIGPFASVSNALKIGAVVTRWEIFNALKIHGAGVRESKQGGTAMQPPK